MALEFITVLSTPSMKVRIIPARDNSLSHINALIVRAKSYWNYPPEYLEQALPLHQLDATYLLSNLCFELLNERDELCGFVGVTVSGEKALLDNLWITPELIGRGMGKQACEYVFRLARMRGWRELWVIPDPPAEGFYKKMGFLDTGERVPSRVAGGPVFSVYRISY